MGGVGGEQAAVRASSRMLRTTAWTSCTVLADSPPVPSCRPSRSSRPVQVLQHVGADLAERWQDVQSKHVCSPWPPLGVVVGAVLHLLGGQPMARGEAGECD